MSQPTPLPGTPGPTPDDAVPAPSGRRRWAVPAVVAGVVAVAAATPPLVAAAGDADLPDVTAEQLVARVLEAEPTPLHGTVVHTARLGLPELPITEMGGADPLALLGGSSTIRVWTDGTERARTSLLGPTSEYSVVRDGPEAWTYSSADDEVVHYRLDDADRARYDELAAAAEAGDLPVEGDLPTPAEAARLALDKADETSVVTLDAATRVAGRDAYQLVVTPRDAGTLVARVVVAVDAETSTPLRLQAWSTENAQVPALEVAFTDVTFAAPDPAVLAFSQPAGSSLREVVVPLPDEALADRVSTDEASAERAADEAEQALASGEHGVRVIGEGWSRVVEVTGADVAALVAGDEAAPGAVPTDRRFFGSDGAQDLIGEFKGSDGPDLDLDTATLYDQLTTAVPEGRLLESTLLSVLVTDDGRVLAGAVPAQTLRDLA